MQRHSTPVLKEFMGRNLLTAYQDTMVSKAAAAMGTRNVGSVVVLDVLGPCGVFTERDILSRVLGKGKDPASTVIGEVLPPSFPAVDANADLENVAIAMVKRRSRLMVFEGPELVGIVTPTDMVRVLGRLDYDFPLDGVISRDVATVFPETPIDVAVKVMSERRIGSLVVSEDGYPQGIFTERDLLKKVVARGGSLSGPVSEFSTSPVVTSDAGILGREAAATMAEYGIKRLPLMRGDQLVAMVTARDVVEAYAESWARPSPRVDWVQWN